MKIITGCEHPFIKRNAMNITWVTIFTTYALALVSTYGLIIFLVIFGFLWLVIAPQQCEDRYSNDEKPRSK